MLLAEVVEQFPGTPVELGDESGAGVGESRDSFPGSSIDGEEARTADGEEARTAVGATVVPEVALPIRVLADLPTEGLFCHSPALDRLLR